MATLIIIISLNLEGIHYLVWHSLSPVYQIGETEFLCLKIILQWKLGSLGICVP